MKWILIGPDLPNDISTGSAWTMLTETYYATFGQNNGNQCHDFWPI